MLQTIVFEGASMEPSFHDGDRILMTDNIGDLKRLDVIYFRYPKDETKAYMKRIVGLPGEKVEVKNGVVFVNDEEIDEGAYVDPSHNNSRVPFPPRIIA
jgi:signal peptidase I